VRELADGVTAEGFDSVMHLHVRAALFGMKYAVPIMREQGSGSIISTASIAGLRTGYGPLLYSIAKAAVVHMTHAAAAQLGAENIRVNCICPGMIATNIFAASFGIPRQLAETRIDALAEANKHTQPIPRGGRGSDIAEAALYLGSDGASFVTGHALVVDGGITLGPNDATRMATFAPVFGALGIDAETVAAIFNPPKRG
jgi:NAD(P)-dependent dehydrogenase (short-subunit alcohol dehydrogenase family)